MDIHLSREHDRLSAILRSVTDGVGKSEKAYGDAYQRLVKAGKAPQIKRKYRG